MYTYLYVFTNSACTGRMWLKVNILVEFNSFEYRFFFFPQWMPNQG